MTEPTTPTPWPVGTSPHGDLDLVRRAAAGDRAALSTFTLRLGFVPRVLFVLNRRRGRPLSDEELEDVVQDTVTLIWHKLRDYSGGSRLETWLYPFCMNVLRNAAHKKQRRARVEDALQAVPEQGAAPVPAAAEFEHVHMALLEIDPARAEVIRQRFFEDRSFPEIARCMAAPAATVKTWFYRGLNDLRRVLGSSEEAR